MDNPVIGPFSKQAVDYCWRQLAIRAGVTKAQATQSGFESLSLPIYYLPLNQIPPGQPALVVIPCSPDSWDKALRTPPYSLNWLDPPQVFPSGYSPLWNEPIPAIFWGQGFERGLKPFAERLQNGNVVIYVDILSSLLFMFSRWEEAVIFERDEHDRFLAENSFAWKQKFLDLPIIDYYALILRAWIETLLPTWKPSTNPIKVKATYDIDNIMPFRGPKMAVRAFGRDFFKLQDIGKAMGTLNDIVYQVVAPARTTSFQGIFRLAELSQKTGIQSAFYFMAAEPGPFDNGYSPESPFIKKCILSLQDEGFEIGLHSSYRSLNDPARLAGEKARLDAVIGHPDYGGRQHYLRFIAPDTWRHWEQAGFTYDSTMAYAGKEGFRCGTCYPFQPYDLLNDREMTIEEQPLIVMDATLKNYQKYTPEEGEKRILELAQRCKQVGGVFTILWHNTSLFGEWSQWAAMFERVLMALSKLM